MAIIETGFYFGTCTNITVKTTARIALQLSERQGDIMKGSLGIYGDLGGGGDFFATIDGNRICFATHEPKHKLSIVWHGSMQGRNLVGAYTVTASGLMMRVMGLGHQEGTWACSFAKGVLSPASVTASEETRLVVRSKGRNEGPFLIHDFVELLIKGHWDHNADVSTDRQATWIPIGVLADHLARSAPPEQQGSDFWPDVSKDVAKKVVAGFAASVILGLLGINS